MTSVITVLTAELLGRKDRYETTKHKTVPKYYCT